MREDEKCQERERKIISILISMETHGGKKHDII